MVENARSRYDAVGVPYINSANLPRLGAMGLVVDRIQWIKWRFGTDVIWMSLGTTVRETNVDFDQGAFSFYGLRPTRSGGGRDVRPPCEHAPGPAHVQNDRVSRSRMTRPGLTQ